MRGEQQIEAANNQTMADLRYFSGFTEYGKTEMSQFADCCRRAGLEDLYFLALKKKMPNRSSNESDEEKKKYKSNSKRKGKKKKH